MQAKTPDNTCSDHADDIRRISRSVSSETKIGGSKSLQAHLQGCSSEVIALELDIDRCTDMVPVRRSRRKSAKKTVLSAGFIFPQVVGHRISCSGTTSAY